MEEDSHVRKPLSSATPPEPVPKPQLNKPRRGSLPLAPARYAVFLFPSAGVTYHEKRKSLSLKTEIVVKSIIQK
jgi:hypothetical protein